MAVYPKRIAALGWGVIADLLSVATFGLISASEESGDTYTKDFTIDGNIFGINSLSQSWSLLAGGDTLTITGAGFTDAIGVTFNFGIGPIGVDVVVVDDNTITCTIPVAPSGAEELTIYVTAANSATSNPVAFKYKALFDLTPTMSSNTAPSGEAWADGSWYAPYLAFNNSTAFEDAWISDGPDMPAYFGYNFDSPQTILEYSITTRNRNDSDYIGALRTWELLGSEDGENWDTLDAQTDITDWASTPGGVKKTFTLDDSYTYQYFALWIYAINGSDFAAIGEMELLGINWVWSETFTIDGYVAERKTKTFTIDSIVKETKTKTFTIDGLVAECKTKTFTIDGYVVVRAVEIITIDSIIRLTDSYFTRSAEDSLPNTNAPLSTAYSSDEYVDVATDDTDLVGITGESGKTLLHEFLIKEAEIKNTSITWIGQSSTAPSSNTVYLQIWNYNSEEWETLDSDNSTAADTDFILAGEIVSSLSDYFDATTQITVRVYQVTS